MSRVVAHLLSILSRCLVVCIVIFTTGLATHQAAAGDNAEGLPSRPSASSATCAGIRGNGQNLFAHYGALARHVEEYGAITCAAGGSSGSITTFLLESIWANPALHQCGESNCKATETDLRMALLLKSVIGLVDTGLFEDAATVGELLQGIEDDDIMALLKSDSPLAGVEAFIRLLRDLGPLVNPGLFVLLANSPDPVFHITDIIEGLQKGINFIVDDPRVFLRTSVINFDEFASLLGVYGSFFAGYGPADRTVMEAWLATCSAVGVGLTWEELRDLPGSNGLSCGDEFSGLFNVYREAFAEVGGPNRADDPVGRYLPVFGVTGVLRDDAIPLWEEARAAWIAAQPIPFEPNFRDTGVGYWGSAKELKKMEKALERQSNVLMARQFEPLGAPAWREVLGSSPAEPGFSPAVPLSGGLVSVGGWADPLRVLPLEALGAKVTIAINRLGGVGGFTESVTRLLNATDEDISSLYSTTEPGSTFFDGLGESTGVWCTDWDGQEGDPNRLFNDAYTSPLITSSRRLLNPGLGYENVGPDFAIAGCVPGLAVQ